MKTKIYLAPSNQISNIYYGRKTNEAEQCNNIAGLVKNKLLKYKEFDVMVGTISQTLYAKATHANNWGADSYIAIHTNASGTGTAKGTEVWYYTGSKNGKNLASCIYEPVKQIIGSGRGLKDNVGYQDLKNPAMPSIILEIGFHDNADESKFIINNHDKIANAIVKGICKYYKVEYIEGNDGLDVLFSVRANAGLNIRTGPGTDYKSVGYLEKGEESDIYDTNEDKSWGYNKKGWHSIKTKYVDYK